ncbi:MAG: biopolymer transporter ExbD [Bacteroidia bacterium]|nr:biopolymer transporter ExbD [Bacteroidia bacterium]NNJ54491.1 biopolymer transporter ExbD [Bacteroidia bacterium]
MSKFKNNKGKSLPAINTSALPDIVFMLLFFFMVATKMRDREMKVKTLLPKATEVEKLEKKSRLHYIFVGPPLQSDIYGTTPRIQLDDKFATVDDIQDYITLKNSEKDEKEVPYMTTSLKADKTVKMGIITDIKQELREVNALKLSYTASKDIGDD